MNYASKSKFILFSALSLTYELSLNPENDSDLNFHSNEYWIHFTLFLREFDSEELKRSHKIF